MRSSNFVFGSFLFLLSFVGRSSSGKVYRPFDGFLKPYINFVDGVFRYLENGSSLNVTESCRNETNLLLTLAEKGDEQALKFLDATGKPDSGLLEGSVNFLGFYSECLSSHIQNGSVDLLGKYCLVEISYTNTSEQPPSIPQEPWNVFLKSGKKPSFGFCIPLSCDKSDIQIAVNKSGSDQFYSDVANVVSCSVEYDLFSDPTAIFVMVFLILLIAFVLYATSFDVLYVGFKKEPSQSSQAIFDQPEKSVVCSANQSYTYTFSQQLLLSFSFTRNASKLLSVKSSPGSRNIDALNGIRFLSMVYIILLHTSSFALKDLFFRNGQMFTNFSKELITQIFTNGTLAVDTFYFMSGLLVTYSTLRVMERQNKLDIMYFFVHRIIRLTPLLLIVIAFCAGLLRYVGSGPNWSFSILMHDDWCRKNWWLTAMYLQNFVHTENMCLSHAWYLATDFQFYVLTPPVLILLSRNICYGSILIAVYFVLNVIITFTLTVLNNFPAVPYMSDKVPVDVLNEYYRQVYIKPYCRMGPYLVGIYAGYFFLKQRDVPLKKVYVTLFWALSTSVVLFILFIMFQANNGNLPSAVMAALYSAFARTFWASSIAWVTIACAYGYGGLVNSFLSWKAFVPLSRLTYCAYLIHPVIMAIYNGCSESTLVFSHLNLLYLFLGNLVCTYAVSFVLVLLFESPFVALESAFWARKASKSTT